MKKLRNHLGVVWSAGGYGIRVANAELEEVRKALCLGDVRYNALNLSVIGKVTLILKGVSVGAGIEQVAQLLVQIGIPAIPMHAIVRAGKPSWFLKADVVPSKTAYFTSAGTILVEEAIDKPKPKVKSEAPKGKGKGGVLITTQRPLLGLRL